LIMAALAVMRAALHEHGEPHAGPVDDGILDYPGYFYRVRVNPLEYSWASQCSCHFI